MEHVMSQKNQKIHPHKFTLWVAMGSITMMFAGFTSAYIVKSNMAGWEPVRMPNIFYLSTFLILLSSGTIYLAKRKFQERAMSQYRVLVTVTAALGLLFMLTQYLGFSELWMQKITFSESVAGSFFYVISGVHGLHVLGGVIALMVIFARAFSSSTRYYSANPIEVVSIYWHFVDVLWLYLFVFFILVS
jgi:cytochrome c oxidase subunit 3